VSDYPDLASHTLELLKRLNGKIDSLLIDVGDIKTRLVVVAEGIASMAVRIATTEVSTAQVIRRLDRIESRLERIERRLDLNEGSET
jgi:phage shock protein A